MISMEKTALLSVQRETGPQGDMRAPGEEIPSGDVVGDGSHPAAHFPKRLDVLSFR